MQPGIFEDLAPRFPLTVAAFGEMEGGEDALRAVLHLEERWRSLNSGLHGAEPFSYVSSAEDLPATRENDRFDVVIAGGGLGLVAGVALARRGLRVLVFDRERAGQAHREWNISERELGALTRWGIFEGNDLREAITARYTRGLIAFHADGTGVPSCPLNTKGVLDVALDAQSVLDLAREEFLRLGGEIRDGRAFRKLHMPGPGARGPVRSVFEVEGPRGREFYSARLAIDTMGAVSPIALGLNGGLPFDGVCPTAGTVLEGLAGDHSVGDVLVSVANAQEGRQLIWEGFPARPGETTVYLFYYDRTGPDAAREQSLLDLFERYFALLPTYRGTEAARHLRPVFGYIPARHGRTGRTAARGLLCLGDSAAGQSPLTFCGFGSFVRHIGRVAALVQYALRHNLLHEEHLRLISPHQANLRVAWVFSRFMQPFGDEASVNRLMNIFCKALNRVGPKVTVRFLQDRYTFGEYLRIMMATARIFPGVFALAARVLGVRGLAAWLGDLTSFAADDAGRALLHRVGAKRWRALEHVAGRLSPGLRLRLESRRSAWQALE